MLRMVFDEQKRLPDSASIEVLWTATAAITSAEHKGKMTADISQRGELSYRCNRWATRSQAPSSGVPADTTSCMVGAE
jgi:hypothetical protein